MVRYTCIPALGRIRSSKLVLANIVSERPAWDTGNLVAESRAGGRGRGEKGEEGRERQGKGRDGKGRRKEEGEENKDTGARAQAWQPVH